MPDRPSATSWRPIALITVLVAAGALWYTRVLWGSFGGFVLSMDNCELTFCDFVRHYWRMGRTLLETHEPVAGFFYSPFFALLMTPLGALPKETAVAVWGVVQGLALAALFGAPLTSSPARRPLLYAIYAVTFAASIPLYHNLKWGQISVPLTALTLIALELERRGRSTLAGILLAFATALKGYVGVFALVLVLRRRWRGLLAFASALVVFALVIPALLLGIGDTLHFYQLVNQKLTAAQSGIATNPNSQGFASVWARWTTDPQATPPAPSPTLRALGWILAAANLVAVRRWLRGSGGFDVAVSLMFLSLPLVLQTSWPHYFAYLPYVILVAATRLLAHRPLTRWHPVAGVWLLTCLLLSSLPALHLAGRWVEYSRAGWLLVANLALLALLHAQGLLPRRSVEP